MSGPVRAHVFVEENLIEAKPLFADTANVFLYSQASPDRTTPNEDAAGAWCLPTGTVVLAVADGLGGLPQGRVASGLAMEALGESLARIDSAEANARSGILDAFESANERIQSLAGAGTTLVVAEINGKELRTYHVGDSAALLVGQRGVRKWETISHSPVGYGVAAGLIDEASALEHEDRHYLSNHLGTLEMHIEVGSTIRIAARDTLLLATDGLLDNLAPEEIVEIIRAGSLDIAAQRLVDESSARMRGEAGSGKPDDTTFILFRRNLRS